VAAAAALLDVLLRSTNEHVGRIHHQLKDIDDIAAAQ
jgi:hypothetical protein